MTRAQQGDRLAMRHKRRGTLVAATLTAALASSGCGSASTNCERPADAGADAASPSSCSAGPPMGTECHPLPMNIHARLRSSDESTREDAVHELANMLPSPTVEALVRPALADPAARVREWAFGGLSHDGSTITPAETPLGIDTPFVSARSPSDLGSVRSTLMGTEAPAGWAAAIVRVYGDASDLPALRALTSSSNAFVRFQGALSLVALGDVTSGEAALAALSAQSYSIDDGYYIWSAVLVQRRRGVVGSTTRMLAIMEELDRLSGPGGSSDPNVRSNAGSQSQALQRTLSSLHCVWNDGPAGWRSWFEANGGVRP